MLITSKSRKMTALKKLVLLILSFALIGAFLFIPNNKVVEKAEAQTAADELKATEKKLKDLQAQQAALKAQIQKEEKNQLTLAQQAKNLERTMQQNQYQIEELQLELEKNRLELEILTKDQETLQKQLEEVNKNLSAKQDEMKVSLNLLYKMSLNSGSFLETNNNFQESALNQEKERSAIRIIKSDVMEVKRLEAEIKTKKDEIDAKQKAVADLQAQKQAQSDALNLNQQALQWQKANKEKLLAQSLDKEDALSDQQARNNQLIRQMEEKKAAIFASLTNLPPSNTLVKAGQVIGFQGRSGLSCSIYDPAIAPKRTNTYCQDYGGLSNDWYYYDPVNFPSKGSHLHFIYNVGGKQVNADEYIRGAKKGELAYMPLSPLTVTQGSHFGGAVDMVSGHGAPIYAVKRGFISYFCSNYPPVPGFPDPAFGAVVKHVDANGKLDGTASSYWHMQRRGYPCS